MLKMAYKRAGSETKKVRSKVMLQARDDEGRN